MTTIQFPFCELAWNPEQRKAVCRFKDGTEAHACPHDTDEYRAHAAEKSTGNEDMYCWQHEIAHIIVAQIYYNAPSSVLWNLAHNRSTDTDTCTREEQMAQDFQRKMFLRG